MSSSQVEKLGALGRDDVLKFDPDQLTIVQDNPKHSLYNERPEVPTEAMVRDVMIRGVHTPIKVRYAGERPDGTKIVEVVYGTQRVRAARLAKLRKLAADDKSPVIVRAMEVRGSDLDMMGLMISENAHRRQSTPIANARLAQRYMEKGASEEETCIVFSITEQTLHGWMALLECCQEVQDAVEHKQLAAVAAIELRDLDHDRQRKALAEMIESGATKGYAAVEAAENAAAGKPARASQERAHMRTRKFIDRACTELAELKADSDCKIALYTLRYLKGEDAALSRLPATVREVFKDLQGKGKKTKAKS
jgi:ParB family chromosome partitioning protein